MRWAIILVFVAAGSAAAPAFAAFNQAATATSNQVTAGPFPPSSSGGGDGGGSPSPPPSPEPPDPSQSETSAPARSGSEAVTPSGATVDAGGGATVDGGATVVVPPGGLPPGVTLSLTVTSEAPTDVPAPSGARFIDMTVELTSSAPLTKPALIRLNLMPENDPMRVGAGLVVNGRVEVLPLRVVDAAAGIVEITATHFSRFALFTITRPGPDLNAPPAGSRLPGLGTTLSWINPSGAVQYQVQVVPFGNDGPGIDLLRNTEETYRVEAPAFGTGNYVMLPDMTYLWRVRTTSVARPPSDLTDADWDAWSASWFHTGYRGSAGVAPVDAGPDRLTWSNADEDVFYYEVQISRLPDFGPGAFLYWELRHGGVTDPPNSYAVPAAYPLEPATTYYWRVRPRIQGDGAPVGWSPAWSFTTN